MTEKTFEPEFVATLVELTTDGKPVPLVPPVGYSECDGWLASSRPCVVEAGGDSDMIVGVGQHPCIMGCSPDNCGFDESRPILEET